MKYEDRDNDDFNAGNKILLRVAVVILLTGIAIGLLIGFLIFNK